MTFDHSALDLSAVPGTPVLVGVGGSHAYGLATSDSDVDYRGCFVVPTRALFALDKPPETYDRHDPDCQLHEVEKFLSLAAKANPTILEVLFYSEWAVKTPIGELIIDNRDLFITSKIRETHIGFARSQFFRLQRRQGTFSADTAKRTEKHARHLLRLVLQAERALTTGEFRITVDDTEEIFAFGRLDYEDMIPVAKEVIERVQNCPSVLPPEPDRKAISDLLVNIREIEIVNLLAMGMEFEHALRHVVDSGPHTPAACEDCQRLCRGALDGVNRDGFIEAAVDSLYGSWSDGF